MGTALCAIGLCLLTLGNLAISVAQCPDNCRCLGHSVVCDNAIGLHLTKTTFPNPGDISLIVIKGSYIPLIASEAFSGMKSVSLMQFDLCQIDKVSSRAFEGMRGGEGVPGILFNNVSVTLMDSNAFSGVENLNFINFNSFSVGNIKSNAFSDIEAQAVYFSYANITAIDSYAFGQNLKDTELVFQYVNLAPENGIAEYTFTGMDNGSLKFNYVRMGPIKANAFSGISTATILLKDFEVEAIGSDAFNGVRNARNIGITGGVIGTIETGIFGDMTPERDLASPTVVAVTGNKIKTIRTKAFKGLADFTIFLLSNNTVECLEEDGLSGVDADTMSKKGNAIVDEVCDPPESTHGVEATTLPAGVKSTTVSPDAIYTTTQSGIGTRSLASLAVMCSALLVVASLV